MTIADLPVRQIMPGPHTPQDVLELEEEGLYKLVGGHLVETPRSTYFNWLVGQVLARLHLFTERQPIRKLFMHLSFQCFDHAPDRVRRPDVAVLSNQTLSGWPEGHIRVRPDLAVEIVSPKDKVCDLDEKLNDYRLAGVPLLWVLNPQIRKLTVRHADGRLLELSDADTLTADPVLPGFAAKVSDLFPPLPKSNP